MNLTKDILVLLSKLPTGNVADNNPNGWVMDPQIRPVNPALHMIGRAFPVQCKPGDNLALHQGIYSAQPGDVVIFNVHGYCGGGHFGDIMATACKCRGLAGAIIDGSCRDSEDIKALNFPVYARAFCPAGTIKESLADFPERCVVGGALVKKGDLIFADCDGVVVVPLEEEDVVLRKALAKYEKEQHILQELEAGRTTLEIYGFDRLIADKQK